MGKYVVVIHSSGEQFKIWDSEKFIILVNQLINKYSFDIYLIGSTKDLELGQKIIEGTARKEKMLNLSGQLYFPDLIDLVNGAFFVV